MDPELSNYEVLGSVRVKLEDTSADRNTECSGLSHSNHPPAMDASNIKIEDTDNGNTYGQCSSLFDEIYQPSELTLIESTVGHEYGRGGNSGRTGPSPTDIKVESNIHHYDYMEDILADLSRTTDTQLLVHPRSLNDPKDNSPHLENVDFAMSKEPLPAANVTDSREDTGFSVERQKCKTCGEEYNKFDDYVSHLLTHNTMKTPIDKPKDKLHACTTCPKVFTRAHNLQKHMQTHTNSKALASPQHNKRSSKARSVSWDDKTNGSDAECTSTSKRKDSQRQAQPKESKIKERRSSQPAKRTTHLEKEREKSQVKRSRSTSHVRDQDEQRESSTHLRSSSNHAHQGEGRQKKQMCSPSSKSSTNPQKAPTDSVLRNERSDISGRKLSRSSNYSTTRENRRSDRGETSQARETGSTLHGSWHSTLSKAFVHDSRCHSLGLLHPRHPSHEVNLSSKELSQSIRTMTTGRSNQKFWKFVKHISPHDTLLCPFCPSDATSCKIWSGHRIVEFGYDNQTSLIDHICVYHYPFVDPLSCPKCDHKSMNWQVTKKHVMQCSAAGEPVHPSRLRQPNSFRTYEAKFNENFIPPALQSGIPVTGCHEKNTFQIGPFRFHLKVLEIRGESLESVALRIAEVDLLMNSSLSKDPRSGRNQANCYHNDKVLPLTNLKRSNPAGFDANSETHHHVPDNVKRQKQADLNTAGSLQGNSVSFVSPDFTGMDSCHAPKTSTQPVALRIPPLTGSPQQAGSSTGSKDPRIARLHDSPKPYPSQIPCNNSNNMATNQVMRESGSNAGSSVASVSQDLSWDHPYLREFHQEDIFNVYTYSRQQGDTGQLLPTTGKDPQMRRPYLESLRQNLQSMSDIRQKHAQIDPFTLPDRTYTPAWAGRQYTREMQSILTKLLAGTGDMVEHAFNMSSQFAFRDGMDAGARVVQGFRQDTAHSLRAEIDKVRQELKVKEIARMKAPGKKPLAAPSAASSVAPERRPDPFIELTEEVFREYLQDESVPRAVRRQLYMRLYSQMTKDDTDSPEWLKCTKI